ncbi:ABC transporter permease [Danxiaibacter flavus]|uniref:ABC transporter permease n=1 Tax=Danxiaibacter flavus TaxID=3049108 RepID=A0ABV3ZII2_9BACT|nr:ABC transporter permease [Chitinophagaceae bacterium DXS]
MFKTYFNIALRQLRKQKMYALIKIGGFALSIAACLLIALYIRDELSYDKSYPDNDRIFRITGEYNDKGNMETGADWPPPMAKALKQDYPEVEYSGRIMPHELFYCAGSNQVRRVDAEQNTYEDKFTFADQSILDILQVPMVYGDRAMALAQPRTMVIAKSIADKYFPNENPVGKLMILNNDKDRIYKIGGVMKDFPSTSHLQYNFLLTLTGYELWKGEQDGWMSSNYYTYVKLRKGANPIQFQDKLKSVITRYYVPALKSEGNVQADEMAQKLRFLVQPVADIHLRSYKIDDGLHHGDIRFVWLFGAIACFILLIACINFVNLSTAKSANRAKEVGLRKVLGSYRSGLVQQFLTESMLYSCCSFVLGLLIAWLLLPYFNMLAGKSLSMPWTKWWLVPLITVAIVATGFFAGIYPSLYLSAFKPILVLKGQLSRGSKNSVLRNGLVVFQFCTSIILIISTLVIYKQTHYLLNAKIGFDKDQVMLIQGTNTLGEHVREFKNELLKLSQVKNVSVSDFLPVSGTKRNGNTFWNTGKKTTDPGIFAQAWTVDDSYIQTLGIKLIAGRNFSPEMPSDSQAVIINKTMAEKLNLKDPVGKTIENWGKYPIIGVVEDFNFESMRGKVGALSMHLGNSTTIVSVKLSSKEVKDALPAINSLWKKFAPTQPIRYTFLDENFKNMYADVQRMGNIFTSFAILAIVIACLGLFALSAFMAEQRNKEIGIRKVLGASATNITAMLSISFVRLVMLAILIASPIAWWGMSKWLQDFAYRIQIDWWMVALAGIVAIMIALATVSFQSIRAALANPVKSLRSE